MSLLGFVSAFPVAVPLSMGRSVIAVGLVLASMSACSPPPSETSEGEQILTFEKEIRQEQYPTTMLWAPDNRHLLVAGYADGTARIIDTQAADTSGRVIAGGVSDQPELAWSPDGKLIAISDLAAHSAIIVVSVNDTRRIAKLTYPPEPPPEGCRFGGRALAFTADSHSLWVTCESVSDHATTARFLLAMKLDAASLTLQDKLFLTPPDSSWIMQPSQRTFFSQDGQSRLCTVINSDMVTPKNLGSQWRRFIYCYNLDNKQELFPHFQLTDDGGVGTFRFPQQLVLFPDGASLLIKLHQGSLDPDLPDVPALDRFFAYYRLPDGQRLATYGGHASPGPEAAHIGEAALLPDARQAVASWSHAQINQGGLVVFDPRDGSNLQRIRFGRTRSMAISPDGHHVAAMLEDGHLRLYRANSSS